MRLDSDRIEDILKSGFSADEPDGMRERVLERAVGELRPAGRNLWSWNWVKLAFTCAVLLLIMFANISDGARQTRIAGNTKISYSSRQTVIAAVQRRQLTMEILASIRMSVRIGKTRNQL